MKITTINTIEVSSLCDNACPYCPASTQGKYRMTGLMRMEVFEKAVGWVKHFVERGTQQEVNLHGIGEPTLNPDLVEMIRTLRAVTPGIINFNTNGNKMNEQIAVSCKEAGVSSINVTAHNPLSTMQAVKAVRKAGLPCHVNADFSVSPNNWAGQVKWTDSVDYKLFCTWLAQGWVMITWDGRVTRCCLDSRNDGVFATIWEDLTAFDMTQYKLCETCHHEKPHGEVKNNLI